jgi:hypothetical protein
VCGLDSRKDAPGDVCRTAYGNPAMKKQGPPTNRRRHAALPWSAKFLFAESWLELRRRQNCANCCNSPFEAMEG